jgi:hypothetical protein
MSTDKKQPIKARAVTTYPAAKYKNLLSEYSRVNEISESKVAGMAIRQFFDTLPNDQKAQLLSKNHY